MKSVTEMFGAKRLSEKKTTAGQEEQKKCRGSGGEQMQALQRKILLQREKFSEDI